MDSFVGLLVALELRDGAQMEGVIIGLDEPRQLITLSDVRCTNHGTTTKYSGLLEVYGGDITNIEVVKSPPASGRPVSPLAPASPSRSQGKGRRGRGGVDGWQNDDVRSVKSIDFDFQSNLQLFDKKKIFSEIQQQDTTDVGERLVSHNLSGRGQDLRKMKHTEHVLQKYDEEEAAQERILTSPVTTVQIGKRTEIIRVASVLLDGGKLLFRTPGGRIVDPGAFPKWSFQHIDVSIEVLGRSMASYLLDNGQGASGSVECYIGGGSAFLDAICYCAARHLVWAGASVLVRETTSARHPPQDPSYASLAAHQGYYKAVLAPLNKSGRLLLPTETIIVNATQTDLLRPPCAKVVNLDFVPPARPGEAVSILMTCPEALLEHAHALKTLHPRVDLFLLNAGLLQDAPTRNLFIEQRTVACLDWIRLLPFVE